MKGNAPVVPLNLGSSAAGELDFSREKLWDRMDPAMGQEAVSLPVYLVSPGQMDLLYPPKRRRFLDPQAVRNWARWQREARREREEDREEDPLRGLEEMTEEGYWRYQRSVAAGLYLAEPPSDGQWRGVLSQGGAPSLPKPQGPAIFLCPERILDWADRNGANPHLVLDKVYYHELAHALMDTGPTPYEEHWGRVVEESLANWVAFGRFRGKEARWVQRLIEDQPAEYQGYAHLGEALWVHPQVVADFERFLWHLRHFWEEFLDWRRWARRRGLPLTVPLAMPWDPTDLTWGERGPRWVYEAWKGAKRKDIDPEFWKVYAHHLLLAAFS
ncbi:MAG: hypothetical protein ACK4G4_11500 [Thermus sp.]|uniref:hypothetical protein n=1 Tax=Thermus sp. TaxID=275 RepID=UPI0039189D86